MADVIELSDDDEPMIPHDISDNSVTISIMNSQPLDLNSVLGFGTTARPPPLPVQQQQPLPPPQQFNRYAPYPPRPSVVPSSVVSLAPTMRYVGQPTNNGYNRLTSPSINGMNGRSIRSNTTTTHTLTMQPLQHTKVQHNHTPMINNHNTGQVIKLRLSLNKDRGEYRVASDQRRTRTPDGQITPSPPPILTDATPTESLPPKKEMKPNNYTFDAILKGQDSPKQPDGITTNFRYRCTYQSCCRLITGNVAMIVHVWAHVSTWKPTEDTECEEGWTDVDALSCCPQCLTRFETPYSMQVHYTRAHSRIPQAINTNTCAICESEVKDLTAHLHKHNPYDAPYACTVCSYRCNVRMHLFDHFTRCHIGTSYLFCPFCPYKVKPGKEQNHKHLMRVKSYIDHMSKHEIIGDRTRSFRRFEYPSEVKDRTNSHRRKISCDKCACTFVTMHERTVHLRYAHRPIVPAEYDIRRRKPDTRDRRKSSLVLLNKQEMLCLSCKVKRAEDRPERCPHCMRLSYNATAASQRLIAYSDNKCRSLAELAVGAVEVGKCACNFTSTSGNTLAAHFFSCRRIMNVKMRPIPEKIKVEQTNENCAEEEDELKLFGLDRIKQEESEENMKQKQAKMLVDIDQVAKERGFKLPIYLMKRKDWLTSKDCFIHLEKYVNTIPIDKKASMLFRKRMLRNDYVKSEKLYKEMIKRRDSDE